MECLTLIGGTAGFADGRGQTGYQSRVAAEAFFVCNLATRGLYRGKYGWLCAGRQGGERLRFDEASPAGDDSGEEDSDGAGGDDGAHGGVCSALLWLKT